MAFQTSVIAISEADPIKTKKQLRDESLAPYRELVAQLNTLDSAQAVQLSLDEGEDVKSVRAKIKRVAREMGVNVEMSRARKASDTDNRMQFGIWRVVTTRSTDDSASGDESSTPQRSTPRKGVRIDSKVDEAVAVNA